MSTPRYWVSRPDRDNRALYFTELQAGRLRQGWGFDAKHSLDHLLSSSHQPQWWENLSDMQRAAFKNHPFHPASGRDPMRSGDIVLVPNVPEWGSFSLARLVDDTYHYEPLELSMEQQVNGEVRDYGHWRAVELLTPKGASKYSRFVSAPLQRSLQCRSRIWRVDDHALSINTVLENAQNPEVLLAVGFDARWEAVSEKVREEAHKAALETLERELTHHFYNAGWEAVTREALRVWFPDGEIRLTGGVSEVHHGSDLVIEIANPFSKNEQSEAWLVPVQVKHHVGLEGVAAVRQLEKALLSDALGSRSRIVALVLLTTATALTEEAQVAVQEIKAHHKVQFHVVCRDELLELIVDAIMARKN